MRFKQWVKREMADALGVDVEDITEKRTGYRPDDIVSLTCNGREVLWASAVEVEAVNEAFWCLRCARRDGLDAFDEA